MVILCHNMSQLSFQFVVKQSCPACVWDEASICQIASDGSLKRWTNVCTLYKVFLFSKRGPEVLFHASLKTSNMVTGGLQKALCNHGSVLNECGLATFYKMIFSSDPLWKVSMIEFIFTMWWVLLTSKEKLDLKQFWRLLPSITKICPHFLVFGVSILNL